jgi:hypothetical protein
MIELIRNCLHGSEIATYIRNGASAGKAIIKVATTKDGMDDLKHEYEGWKWYQKIRYPHNENEICKVVQENRSVFKIEIEYIEGLKGNYYKGLTGNAHILEKVVDHYCHLWPCDHRGMGPIHGDLSVDNIIINQEGVHIIDWEHFNLEGGTWGFDLIYLLLETLWHGMRKRRAPTRSEIDIISANMKLICGTDRLNKEIVDQPLCYVKNYIAGHPKIWGKQLTHPADQFPIFRFSAEQTVLIDRSIRQRFKL